MKKKIFAVVAILLTLGTASVFAKGKSGTTGLGAQVGYPLGGALTFKVSSVPCVFAVNISGSNSALNVGLTADWWVANPKISGTWGYFYGVGLFGDVFTGSNNFDFGFGPRALIGTNVFLINGFLEFYLQGGWQPEFWLHGADHKGGFAPNFVNFFGNLGFRFWF